MPCYCPITAWKPSDGALVFSEKKDCREVKIACGQCIGCRIAKRDAWAFRCYAESRLHANNAFVTLTYDDDYLPQHGSLNYRDIQLFHYRMRQKLGPFRFFVCGEYGENTDRPHYHALYFGLSFPDMVKCNSVYSVHDVYKSEVLQELWGKGFCSIGQVDYASARYCAVYTTKKVTGARAEEHYSRVIPSTGEIVKLEPEFARMSLKPGIGYEWLVKYWPEVITHRAVCVNGRMQSVPRYFMDKLEDINYDELEAMKFEMSKLVNPDEQTRERLETRRICKEAKHRFDAERFNHAL